jgi:hypothetical protein
MNITPDERNKAINTILSEGLTRPASTWSFLWNMYRNLGLRVIFWEAAPALAASVAVACAYVVLGILPIALADNLINVPWSSYSALFLFSPALFIGLTISTEAGERISGIYDLKMTCKYTIRQITAFRLLCFSLCGTVFTVIGSAFLSSMPETGYFLQLFSLALCSLFLCSLLLMFTMRRWRGGWYWGAAIWTGIGVLPIAVLGRAWETFLMQMPPALTLCVAAVAFILFLTQIKKEVYRYADC